MSGGTKIFDQNKRFLKDISFKTEDLIKYLLDFDQIAYIYHENIEDKFP